MTIILDSREDAETLEEGVDRIASLDVGLGEGFSYDIQVDCFDETRYTGERKTWPDFVSTWLEGDLERQISYVDFLVVERSSFDQYQGDKENEERALKHLVNLSFQMPVLVTENQHETLAVLRYMESKGEMELRQNRVSRALPSLRESILAQFDHVNPMRSLSEDEALGDRLNEIVDWEAMVDAILYPNGEEKGESPWLDIHGIGPKTVNGIEEGLLEESS